jgi:hypothetical protein
MSIEQAVEILNRAGHRGRHWGVCEGYDDSCVVGSRGDSDSFTLQDFEAIAIAEAYGRRGQ